MVSSALCAQQHQNADILCSMRKALPTEVVSPVVRSDWTVDQVSAAELCSVVVLYASAYGNTAALAQAISRGITKSGVGVQTLNLEQCRCDARLIGSVAFPQQAASRHSLIAVRA